MKRSTLLSLLILCAFALPVSILHPVSAQVPLEEGDLETSYDEYGDDSDEIYEMDDALATPADSLLMGLRWIVHAAFLIEDEKVIYIDPFSIPDKLAETLPKADIILITHDHSDHFSPEDIKKIVKPSTSVVSIEAVVDQLPEEVKKSIVVSPGDTLTVQGIAIEAVPAYNIDKKFHPRDKGYVGFLVYLDGRTIYHAGDTDLIPEMKSLKVDVALLPAGGRFTMDEKEAAEAANLIKPKIAIPMHWGSIVGTRESAARFVKLCKVPARVLESEALASESKEPAKED
jgi:L-ascorbate metabolism protein UlaG (beta-lactamase superfamily)